MAIVSGTRSASGGPGAQLGGIIAGLDAGLIAGVAMVWMLGGLVHYRQADELPGSSA